MKSYKKKAGFEYGSLGKFELKTINSLLKQAEALEEKDENTLTFLEMMSVFRGVVEFKSLDFEGASSELKSAFFAEMESALESVPVIPLVLEGELSGKFSARGCVSEDNVFTDVAIIDSDGSFVYMKGSIPLENVVKMCTLSENNFGFTENN